MARTGPPNTSRGTHLHEGSCLFPHNLRGAQELEAVRKLEGRGRKTGCLLKALLKSRLIVRKLNCTQHNQGTGIPSTFMQETGNIETDILDFAGSRGGEGVGSKTE